MAAKNPKVLDQESPQIVMGKQMGLRYFNNKLKDQNSGQKPAQMSSANKSPTMSKVTKIAIGQ